MWWAHVHLDAVLSKNSYTPVVPVKPLEIALQLTPDIMLSESALVPGSRVFHFLARKGAPISWLYTKHTWLRPRLLPGPRQAGRSSRRFHLLQPQKKPTPGSSTQAGGSLRPPGPQTVSTFCTIRYIVLFSNGKVDVLLSHRECFSSKLENRCGSQVTHTHGIVTVREHISHEHKRLRRTTHDTGTGRNTGNIVSPTISSSHIAAFQRLNTISLVHLKHLAVSFQILAVAGALSPFTLA